MTLEKLIELSQAWSEWARNTYRPTESIPSEIADRAIEALRELTERAKALDASQ